MRQFSSWRGVVCWMLLGAAAGRVSADEPVRDWAKLPANEWTLLQQEAPVQGMPATTFAQAVLAEDVGRIYLWGVGGKMRDRATFDRYELESFAIDAGGQKWIEALPKGKEQLWAKSQFPPFHLHGIEGTDGPRIMLVGTGIPNVVRFLDKDGVQRPSPIHTFNQACYDSKRKRIVYHGGGKTFALDPATNTWTDLAPKATPTACDSLAWASLCYDPVNDEILLFGGGLAFNLEGGARTWLYDCGKNTWYRPKIEGAEPTPRCTTPIVYNPATQSMVLFGGYDQAAALNDTWVYRCKDRRWEQRSPNPSPPPMLSVASASLPGGQVVICGSNALAGTRTHDATWHPKETWIYDIAKNAWQPLGKMTLPARWMSATSSEKLGIAFLVSMDTTGRKTFAFRHDAKASRSNAAAIAKMTGAAPGTSKFKYDDQKDSLAAAPKADPEAQRQVLAKLPVNQFVDANPPGLLVSRTWSGATIDTDRSEVIYTGGGHSGYSGNDVAIYSIADNRWTLDAPPRFPPFLEGTNASVYGMSYGARPWSQHTYLWYNYDPVSKKVIYCARPVIRDGETVLLDNDPSKAFVYDKKKHGHWTWTFDPKTKQLSLPSFGRPFDNPWELCLATTPKGVFAVTKTNLYRATVAGDRVSWEALPGPLPVAKGAKYNYEWMPVVYDAKRDRLIHLMGNEAATDRDFEVHTRGLNDAAWSPLKTTGSPIIGRELMALPKSDSLLLLARNRLFALDLATNAWRELDVAMPKGFYGTEAAMVYDLKHDVSVLLLPKSGGAGALQTFLFRYNPATARFKAAEGNAPE